MESLTDKMESFRRTLHTDPMSSIMNDPVKKARITPGFLRCLSISGKSYFASTSLIMLLSSLFISMPTLYTGPDYTFHVTMALLSFAQVFVNFIFVSIKKGYYDGCSRKLGLLPDPSWRKCIDCNHQMPPRAHHCGLCRRCVLGRDHHCFFTGSCVGHENHRYFVVFTFYCTVGAAYSLYITLEYLRLVHIHPFDGPLHFIAPVTFIEWLFGYSSLGFLYFVIVLYISFLTSFGSGGIFIWQMYLVSQHATSFEFSSSSKTHFKFNIPENYRSIFGPYWGLSFIFPTPWISPLGDSCGDSNFKLV